MARLKSFYLFNTIKVIFRPNYCTDKNIFVSLQRFKGNRKAEWWL